MKIFITIILVAFFIDGIKLLIESFSKKRSGFKHKRNKSKTSAVLASYNEPDLTNAIEGLKNEVSHFILIDDNSSEFPLSSYFEEVGNEPISTFFRDDIKYTVIQNDVNKGKVPSIHMGIEYVDTEFVFIGDADIQISKDFEMPINLLEYNTCDAVCFSVMPMLKKKNIWEFLQIHEYMKSMHIGRSFANNSKSVECISGASGLFKTERIKKFKNYHSQQWQGEDLERTLIELYNNGRIAYDDQYVYTDVPNNFIDLSKQRIYGWWGGLYRNFLWYIKLLFKKDAPTRLKFEMFYNIVSFILDPFKLISLYYILFTLNWIVLISLYIIYIIFEFIVKNRIEFKTNTKNIITSKYIFIYPFYGFIQLHLRLIALVNLIYKKLR